MGFESLCGSEDARKTRVSGPLRGICALSHLVGLCVVPGARSGVANLGRAPVIDKSHC